MQLINFCVLASSLLSASLAAPAANEHALVPRQTYIITCIGGHCVDNGDPPGPTAKPTTSKKPDPPKTTTKPDPPKTTTKPTKSTPQPPEQPSKTTGEEVGPSSTRCPVPLYYKCGGWDGGVPWAGCTTCVKGAKCVLQNEWYYQCVADDGTV